MQFILSQIILLNSFMIFFTGSYTQEDSPAANPTGNGIGAFSFDLENGTIKELQYTKQRNPSYLVVSNDKKYLYAVEEMFVTMSPKVHAYRIGEKGHLALINTQELPGDYACHLSIAENQLLVANYVSGNVLVYPINNDGSLSPHSQLIQHEGTGPNTERQEAAHAHMVYPIAKDQMYVVDLTLDQAKSYVRTNQTQTWEKSSKNDIQVEAGAGSRHMIMGSNNQSAYILGELTGDLFVATKSSNGFEVIQKESFLPKDYNGTFGGAAIRLHPNGTFLYASCRGANTIAVFKIDPNTNKITKVSCVSCEGDTPRDFNIDPTGKWLLVANQDSNTINVFEIDEQTGSLNFSSSTPVQTPVNITWL